jgi:hypothetical protein
MAPRKPASRKRLWIILAVVVALIIMIAALAPAGGQAPATTPQASSPVGAAHSRPAPARAVPTTVAFPHFGDGTFIVGKDIRPGTYRTRQASPNCYYARLKGFGGTIDDIVANNNTDDPAIVTIAASDTGFESTGCGTWTKNLAAITTSRTSFTDGMYIVGRDFQAGTYRSSGQSGCYYARLKGFGGTIDDIVANANTDAPAIVTIAASDTGFASARCGTWTKI